MKHNLYILAIFLTFVACSETDNTPIPTVDYTYLYWTSMADHQIMRAVYQDAVLLQTEQAFGSLKGLDTPTSLVVDEPNQMLYWTDFATRQVLRGAWDGSGNPEVLYTAPLRSYGPVEMVMDVEAGQLYWTQPYDDLILTAPADGLGPVDTLFTAQDGIRGAWGIGLQLSEDYLYWIEYEDNELWRSKLSGESLPELLYAGGSGFLNPYGMAISEATQELFITDNALPGAAYSDRILRGSLDGKQKLETLYDGDDGVSNAYAVVVDEQTGDLYWLNQLNSGSIYRGDIYGGPSEELITDIALGQGLHVFHSTWEPNVLIQ
ncbi:hypothetical protein N6H18_16520 [Reichenbachiella agarivorans]|uniref:Uncharacterized protein n=1 Tax=Reichenbachiella agarivorans TaxID=2979464 RepID=A0ABY6CUN6_9BACT|nr:hypothetical protein [Reichenbachiella agarivorans]UXP31950.1 hypothetical protein N6H18_16520 [Reichenbachiella agarivorans]